METLDSKCQMKIFVNLYELFTLFFCQPFRIAGFLRNSIVGTNQHRFEWTFMSMGWKCNLVFPAFNGQNNSILRFPMRTRKYKNFCFLVKWFSFEAAYEIRTKIWLGSPIQSEQRKNTKIFVLSMNNYLWNVQITVLLRCFCLKSGLFLRD